VSFPATVAPRRPTRKLLLERAAWKASGRRHQDPHNPSVSITILHISAVGGLVVLGRSAGDDPGVHIMLRSARLRSSAMAAIDLEELSDQERQLVVQFVALLRRARQDQDLRTELLARWEGIRAAPHPMTPRDADALAAEAIAYVRSHQ